MQMARFAIGVLILCGASGAHAQATDFGIRSVNGGRAIVTVGVAPKAEARQDGAIRTSVPQSSPATWTPIRTGSASLSSVTRLGAEWGRVTSTWRSVAHNRAVGGVPNSFHLRGRAIDIARRPGVTHAMIAASFRNAGYQLVESLDEGDHSHFAFNFGGWSSPSYASRKPEKDQDTNWGVVTVAASLLR
jgi:hypothetical protein